MNGLGGADVIYGHRWSGPLCGGTGNDWIRGTHQGGDDIDGGDGDDWIYGRAQTDRLVGGTGDDVLVGDPPGPQRWRFGTSGDELYGGPGNDRLMGFGDVDELHGGEGDDLLEGGTASDSLYPGPGDDLVRGGTDGGQDMVLFPAAPGPIAVDLDAGTVSGEGADRLEEIEAAAGTPFDDHFLGSTGEDFFAAGEGADYMNGREGDDYFTPDMRSSETFGVYAVEEPADDVVEGGPGDDGVMLMPKDVRARVEVDLTTGRALGEATDILSSIERLSIGAYAGVRVIGNDADNHVYVFIGSAYIEGGRGDDHLQVNDRDSELDGGDGFDRCYSAEVVRNCEEKRRA